MGKIIVIGGGAGGMMAAIFAARAGAQVTLLERNEKLGKKVYITGKGRCNVTNDCTLDEFLREVPRNPRFLYSALNFFSPQDMMALLENAGCPVVVQRGRRVFPSTEKASDVNRTLSRIMQQAGVKVLLDCRVKAIHVVDGRAAGVVLQDGTTMAAITPIADDDPITVKPRLYAPHFVDMLEKCEAIHWDGKWRITDIGRKGLARLDEEAAVAAEAEAAAADEAVKEA